MINNLISVIIVNFNAGQCLVDCVGSLLQTELALEIFISDNASTDNSIDLVKEKFADESRLQIVKNSANLGFSRGNNAVLAKTKGEYLLFLNPDCIVHPGALEKVKDAMDHHPDAGMASCLIRNEDGTVQATCVRSIPTPWNSLVRILHLNKLFPGVKSFHGLDVAKVRLPKVTSQVDGISGAFMLVRRTAIDQVGLLDEGYFLYAEDLDWMYRFQQQHWRILFVPEAEITHIKGFCGKSRPFRVLWHKHKGMIRFYRKFFSARYPLFLMWLVYLAVWSRFSMIVFLSGLKLVYARLL